MTTNSKVSVGLSILAVIGVGITAYLAHKRSYIYDEKKQDVISKKWNDMNDEEFEENKDKNGDELLSNKDRAVIFLQSEWPTLLSGTVTTACIAGAQILDLKDIIGLSAGLAAVTYKYNDAMNYIQNNFPEQYKSVKKFVDGEAAKRAIANEKPHKEETYDGRQRYYLPLSEQIVYLYPEDLVKIQWFINATIGTEMEIHINDILDFIRYNLNCKDVHLCRKDYIWQFGEDCVGIDNFPEITIDWDDVPDEDGIKVTCKVLRLSYEPLAA